MNRAAAAPRTSLRRPRVGFLGVGWIGRNRMEAMVAAESIEAAAIADASEAAAREASAVAPDADVVGGLEDLLALDLDGLVIATPSALHAEQAIRALNSGLAVFCQKPLGRTEAETAAVVEAARRADRLLGVDLSYRFTAAARAVREAVQLGVLGEVFAADLTFHNAYGPDKAWFYDRRLSGGGCVIDLGVHLVDLALWTLDFPQVTRVSGDLFSKGRRLAPGDEAVEDYAVATIELATGGVVRLACSWNLRAGCDAIIAADFHGVTAGASMRNVGGSFYDFEAVRLDGASRATLVGPPDDWGGRAAADWARRLAEGAGFDRAADQLVEVARVLERICGA